MSYLRHWLDGACREAESVQKSSPRRQQSGFNKPPGEWEECCFQRTAPQRKTQNFTAGILQGKTQNRNVLRASKKFHSLLRTKHVTISSFILQMPAKSIVTRLKHVTNARRATRKCQISPSHKPGTVETVRFPRKMLLEQGWTCEKMPLSWKMHRTHHQRMPQFRCQTCLGLQAGPPCRLFVGSASKPGSESHQTCFCLVFIQKSNQRPFWWAPRLTNWK